MTQVFKIEILVIDHDGNGPTEIASVLENAHYPNRCIAPKVMSIESRDVEWSDSHPLNKRTSMVTTYTELFSKPQGYVCPQCGTDDPNNHIGGYPAHAL